ncbi:hypothetical protein AB0I94_35745 [Streptomyces sp. NPDC050147]|uniref:hypothetical protein n=1 Tax=Streptomyces sp. NPDC050147 TaxID=3155513 RepID=UPI0034415242
MAAALARLLAQAIRADQLDAEAQRRALAAFRSARSTAPKPPPPTRPYDDWRG